MCIARFSTQSSKFYRVFKNLALPRTTVAVSTTSLLTFSPAASLGQLSRRLRRDCYHKIKSENCAWFRGGHASILLSDSRRCMLYLLWGLMAILWVLSLYISNSRIPHGLNRSLKVLIIEAFAHRIRQYGRKYCAPWDTNQCELQYKSFYKTVAAVLQSVRVREIGATLHVECGSIHIYFCCLKQSNTERTLTYFPRIPNP